MNNVYVAAIRLTDGTKGLYRVEGVDSPLAARAACGGPFVRAALVLVRPVQVSEAA